MVRRSFLSEPSEILNGPTPYDDDTPTAAGQVLLAPEPPGRIAPAYGEETSIHTALA
jgi:hypothetical protein